MWKRLAKLLKRLLKFFKRAKIVWLGVYVERIIFDSALKSYRVLLKSKESPNKIIGILAIENENEDDSLLIHYLFQTQNFISVCKRLGLNIIKIKINSTTRFFTAAECKVRRGIWAKNLYISLLEAVFLSIKLDLPIYIQKNLLQLNFYPSQASDYEFRMKDNNLFLVHNWEHSDINNEVIM